MDFDLKQEPYKDNQDFSGWFLLYYPVLFLVFVLLFCFCFWANPLILRVYSWLCVSGLGGPYGKTGDRTTVHPRLAWASRYLKASTPLWPQ